jgi:hypothetical protein
MVSAKVRPGEEATCVQANGSLKIVTFIIRRPCTVIWAVLFFCFISLGLLSQFTDFDESRNAYDLDDVRSIHLDSLNAAIEKIVDLPQPVNTSATTRRALTESSRYGWDDIAAPPVAGYEAAYQRMLNGDTPSEIDWSAPPRRLAAAVVPEVQQSVRVEMMHMGYVGSEGNVFTVSGLAKMREAEGYTRNAKDYPLWCFKDRAKTAELDLNNCSRPFSAVNMFYASEWNSIKVGQVMALLGTAAKVQEFNSISLCYFLAETPPSCPAMKLQVGSSLAAYEEAAVLLKAILAKWDGHGTEIAADIPEIMAFAAFIKQLPMLSWKVDYFFDKGFSATNLNSKYSRSRIEFGGPTAGFVSSEHDQRSQTDAQNKWFKSQVYNPLLDPLQKTGTKDGVEVLSLKTSLIFEVIIDVLIADALLAVGAVLMIFFFIRLQTGSWFIAIMGMLEILFSLPCAYTLYRYIFQIRYFDTLNSMVSVVSGMQRR